jgi:hypothetical protein
VQYSNERPAISATAIHAKVNFFIANCINQYQFPSLRLIGHTFNQPNTQVSHGLGLDRDGLECAIPASINQYLFDYQRQGVEFLFKLFQTSKGAAVLFATTISH